GVETDHEIASQRTLTRRSAALGDCGIHFVNGNASTRLAGRALALLHERATESWTIEMLAARVGMSRSVFAERFGALVGASPTPIHGALQQKTVGGPAYRGRTQ